MASSAIFVSTVLDDGTLRNTLSSHRNGVTLGVGRRDIFCFYIYYGYILVLVASAACRRAYLQVFFCKAQAVWKFITRRTNTPPQVAAGRSQARGVNSTS
jgi:hypothetical protein